MIDKQLVDILTDDFEIWDYYSHISGELKTVSAKDIPFICWPDRVPCIEANQYLLSLFDRSLSRRVKGGTLRTYAFNISHLLKFCHINEINITKLSNSYFALFISGLQAEKDSLGDRVRTNNQVIKIGRTCLDFLRSVAVFHSLTNFIGQEEFNSIVIVEKEVKIFSEGRKKPIIRYYWQHSSFPKPGGKNKRHPISDKAVGELKKVIKNQRDSTLVKRDLCIFESYEQTGGRRTEIVSMLQVEDVVAAYTSSLECPMLRLDTLKKADPEDFRMVPVPRIFIDNLMDYIRTNRRRIIRKKLGKNKDHGYVFISHTTGNPLTPDTISTYMTKWRKEAGFEDPAFLHLIRHAYITEKLKCIILEHDLENKDQFRKALLNTNSFKIKLKEWTGHSNISSLDVYIDLAFADLAGSNKTYSAVTLKSAVEVVKDRLDLLKTNIKSHTVTKAATISEFERIIHAFEIDIDRSLNPKNSS